MRQDPQRRNDLVSSVVLCSITILHFTCTQAGGHGIAWDGPFNKELRRLVEETYATGKIIAAVDHGPAALVHARNIRLGDPREGMPLLFRKDVRAPATTCLFILLSILHADFLAGRGSG